MSDLLPVLIVLLVLLGVAIAGTLIFIVAKLWGELSYLKADHEYLKQHMTMTQLSMSKLTGGSPTANNLLLRPIIENAMKERLSREELENMRFALDLNGTVVDNRGDDMMVSTILNAMTRRRKLIDVAVWIRQNRPDIDF